MKYSDLQIALLYNYALFMLQLFESEYNYNCLYKWISEKLCILQAFSITQFIIMITKKHYS